MNGGTLCMDITKARIKAIEEELEGKYGERVAMRFSGAVTVYTAQGIETPDCEDERIAGVWPEARRIIDEQNAARSNRATAGSFAEYDLLLSELEEVANKEQHEESEEMGPLLRLSESTGVSIGTLKWLLNGYGDTFSREGYANLPKSNLWDDYEGFIRCVASRAEGECSDWWVSNSASQGCSAFDADEERRELFGIQLEGLRSSAEKYGKAFTPGELAGIYASTSSCPSDAKTWEAAYRAVFGGQWASGDTSQEALDSEFDDAFSSTETLPAPAGTEGAPCQGDESGAAVVADASHGSSSARRVYVSDVVDMRDIKRGKLNLIYAPCGSGKTTFVEQTLKEPALRYSGKDLLYLAPTISLREAVERRGYMIEAQDWAGRTIYEWRQEGITAMTYASFGAAIYRLRNEGTYKDANWWNGRAVICADELSQAIRQSNYPNNGPVNFTKLALGELKRRIRNPTNVVVTIGATPKAAIEKFTMSFTEEGKRYFDSSKMEYFHNVKMSELPVGYSTREVVYYDDLDGLLASLDPSQRGLIYIGSIKSLLETECYFALRGIKAKAIYSWHNKKYKMDMERQKVAGILVNEEKLPDDVQVLLINAAYETGLNIRPERSHLDYVIVHDSNPDVQIQARGRYRGDLDTAYYKRPVGEKPVYVVNDEVIAPYLERRLSSEDKRELSKALGFRGSNGQALSWTGTKRILIESGFVVEDKKSGSVRYTLIKRVS